jgi:soluble lytic murein transglycosylase-like protein
MNQSNLKPVTDIENTKDAHISKILSSRQRQLNITSTGVIFCLILIVVLTIFTIESTNNQITTTTKQNNDLKKLILNLQNKFFTNTSENTIYLKLMILNDKVDHDLAKEISENIFIYSKLYDKEPDLILALIKIESNFNSKAISNVGAVGLTQIMPFWKEIFRTNEDFFEVETSVKYCMQILSLYEKQYGSIEMALTAYNRGHYQIENALAAGRSPNNGYSSRIMEVYNRLQSMNIGD